LLWSIRVKDRRERLCRTGPALLADDELVAMVLGSSGRVGNPSLADAREVLQHAGGLAPLASASPWEIAAVPGVGLARAARLAAGFELGRRTLDRVSCAEPVLAGAADVYRWLRPSLALLAQEVFVVIAVDVRNAILVQTEVCRGALTGVEVHPREVFRPLIRVAAAGAIVAHNHPSGSAVPSRADIELTHRLRAVGDLVGIPIVDHVIVGAQAYTSMAEWLGADF
jgi:DNA repair protein RadC